MALPTGSVTFLLTDIEGSTRLWDAHPAEMAAALARHDQLVGDAVAAHGGTLLKTRGEGDSTFSVFDGAGDAVRAALTIQRAVGAERWPDDVEVRVRASVHTGEAELRDGDYFGTAVNRAARLRAAAHGGQVVLSEAAAQLVGDGLPADASLHDLGVHRLRDLSRSEHVYELRAAGLRTDFPPLASLDARAHNLPAELTSFVGRDREATEVTKVLAEQRLVTLTGVGGTGKTRLALHVAAAVAADFADGVWLVELATLADGALVPGAVAGALGVREEPGRTLLDAVEDHVRGRSLLLIVDNCEHVVAAAAEVVERLLRVAPELRVLATSREPIGVAGEVTFVVQPMSDFDALQLFAERAALIRPTFAPEDTDTVTRVCRRLDGIPLAIELAAARVNVLSVQELDARLEDRFRLLTSGRRTAEGRQQTLRAAIDWSYDLLSEDERDLFARLAVFAGGATLPAIESICGDCLDALGQLVDKSLVVVDSGRYRMLETMRAYASERLAERDDADELRRSHFAWVAAIAADERTTAALDTELDNVRAALAWALTDGKDTVGAADLAAGLAPFWFARGHWAEAVEWLDALVRSADVDATRRSRCASELAMLEALRGRLPEAFAAAEIAVADAGDEATRAQALLRRGTVRHISGDVAAAVEDWEELAALARSAGLSGLLVSALGNLGVAAHSHGHLAEARAHFEEALAVGPSAEQAEVVTGNLGALLVDLGEYDRARDLIAAALEETRSGGNLRRLAFLLRLSAKLEVATGSAVVALETMRECEDLARRVGDDNLVSAVLTDRAVALRRQGEVAEAVAAAEEAVALVDGPFPRLAAARRLELAVCLAANGQRDGAAAALDAALASAMAGDWRNLQLESLRCTALVAAADGDAEGAAVLFAAFDAQSDRGVVLTPDDAREIESCRESLRGLLGDGYGEATARGAALALEESLRWAVERVRTHG